MRPICSTGLVGLNEHNLMFYRTRPRFMAERRGESDLQFHTYSFAALSALCPDLWISAHHPAVISPHSGEFSFPLGRHEEHETVIRDFCNVHSKEKASIFVPFFLNLCVCVCVSWIHRFKWISGCYYCYHLFCCLNCVNIWPYKYLKLI